MTLAVKQQSESSVIGMLPPVDGQPRSSSPGPIIYEFTVPAAKPLQGGVSLASVMKQLEREPVMASRLKQARRNLSEHPALDKPAFRALRLSAGLSQAGLAERAGSTQSYIARIEAGTLDPGTDMIARLAGALGVAAVEVFAAIRFQRG